jgi:hypothetical protein
MREFGLILAAALGSAALGAAFGWAIGRYAPEFLTTIFPFRPIEAPTAVATALGAVSGLVLGAGAMTAGLFIAAMRTRGGGRNA